MERFFFSVLTVPTVLRYNVIIVNHLLYLVFPIPIFKVCCLLNILFVFYFLFLCFTNDQSAIVLWS